MKTEKPSLNEILKEVDEEMRLPRLREMIGHMTLDKLLWRIPQYKRRKVIKVVDVGTESLRKLLEQFDHHQDSEKSYQCRGLWEETIHEGGIGRETYFTQNMCLPHNRYKLAEDFMSWFTDVRDEKIIALIGNLFSNYVAGDMWADGMNPGPDSYHRACDRLDRGVTRWAHMLSYIDPTVGFNLRKYSDLYLKKLG